MNLRLNRAARFRQLLCFGLSSSMLLAAQPVLAATASAPGDLAISISGPDTGVVGTPAPVTVTVTNTTSTSTTLAASEIVILVGGSTAQIQGGVRNSTGGPCARNGQAEQFCSVPGIAPGASATLVFSVEALAPGSLTAAAAQAFSQSSVFASISMTIAPAPTDVQVSGSASTGSPARGASYAYTFQVKDNGPWLAPGVTFSDVLPGGVTLISVSSTVGSCGAAAGTVTCDLGDLGVGAQAVVTETVQAPLTPATIVNTASVAMADADRQPANNSVGVTVQVK
jgi:uncharacterized repeat protein (TIGR01451 family)